MGEIELDTKSTAQNPQPVHEVIGDSRTTRWGPMCLIVTLRQDKSGFKKEGQVLAHCLKTQVACGCQGQDDIATGAGSIGSRCICSQKEARSERCCARLTYFV